MKSEIFTIKHDDGTYQKYQVISDFSWRDVHYITPKVESRTISEVARLYKVNILPKLSSDDSYIFFNVPSDFKLPFDRECDIGYVYDNGILLRNVLESEFEKGHIIIENGNLISSNPEVNNVLKQLYDAELIDYCENTGHRIKFFAVNDTFGFISNSNSKVCVNSHFFLMEPSDIDSPYCKLGTCYGLSLENGVVNSPPLNHRKLLMVDKNERVTISSVELDQMRFVIDETEYVPGVNCTLHFRPDEYKTPSSDGCDLIIMENRVVAIKDSGESIIPVAGFVISLSEKIRINDVSVVYKGFEDYIFAAQVGPEMVVDGEMKDSMDCPFFDLAKDDVVFAPTVYPLPYGSARAARICLGTDSADKPIIIWAEGAGKLGIDRNKDSTGASLLEMAEFCSYKGFKNVINLDGGGSAQILYNRKRLLKIADRLPISNDECERPVANGIVIF